MAATTERAARTRRLGLHLGAGLLAGIAAVVISASAASAHVRVTGTDTTQGGYGVLTFRVPTESATASTTGLTVTLPSDNPIVSASTQPIPGWKATVTTAKLTKPVKTDDGEITTYVSRVTWSATSTADGIKPGEFQQFNLSVGPLPKKAEVAFPALQTYSDGTSVNWNQTATGSAEPEHPAPLLTLAAATSDSAASTPTASATTAASATNATSDGAGLLTGIVGIVLGAIAVILALIALLRSRRDRAA